MTQRSLALVSIVVSLAAGGCGEAERNVTSPAAGKADQAGGEVPAVEVVSRSPVPGATRPATPQDIALRATAPIAVGPVREDAAHLYPVHIEVHNVGPDPVSLERVWLHSSVYEDGLLVRDCGDHAPELVTAQRMRLEPGQSFALRHGLPCGLTEPGRYDLASVVMVGMAPEAVGLEPALEFSQSIATPLVISENLPPFEPADAASE